MNYSENILKIIGKTPMVRINNEPGRNSPLILAKLEFTNPGGSVKDRMASYILQRAIKDGRLKQGDTVIDNTSGNTGVAMAMVASVLGLKAILTIPDKTSKEKIDLIRSFGAEVIITSAEATHDDPEGCYMKAVNLAQKHGYFHMNQYHNQDNVMAHYLTTGPEIWEDSDGKVSHFVAGIGTGGTFSGVSRFLKEKNSTIKAIAVDPVGSIFAAYIKSREISHPESYQVEGIGSDTVTEALHTDLVDDVITVTDKDAFETARGLARSEGISVGGSAGAAVWAAKQVARELDNKSIIVIIIADSGTRYLSKCFNDVWMREHGFLEKK
ncbi:MAG: cysteine synthase family protein [candidate division Zixibacteria bacterium]|nr:cysteine synthase family protein [candidate division Zixibacteria bacterium]